MLKKYPVLDERGNKVQDNSNKNKRIRMLLADSSTFTRIVLANALEQLGFDVVAVAKDDREALGKWAECRPDIALIDLNLKGMGGIDVIRVLVADNPSAIVVLLMPENIDDPEIIVQAVRAGARSFIKKPTSGEEMGTRLSKLLRAKGE